MKPEPLPVPVLEGPHWRVNLRPGEYQPELIPTLSQCFETIQQTKVRLRGWDYPHLSTRDTERAIGSNWIASWTPFMNHNEYWRFYQSGQFLHLFSVREITNEDWRAKLRRRLLPDSAVPGVLSILNFLYTVTEIFEFSTRLCEKGIYRNDVTISIELKNVKGFILSEEDGFLPRHSSTAETDLGKAWTVHARNLIAGSKDYSLAAVGWFFERFGWLNPPLDALKKDQERFLKGLI